MNTVYWVSCFVVSYLFRDNGCWDFQLPMPLKDFVAARAAVLDAALEKAIVGQYQCPHEHLNCIDRN